MTPDEAKKMNEMDQAIALMSDLLPRSYWGLYNGLCNQGFTPDQAFNLTQTYVLSQAPQGCHFHTKEPNNKKPKDDEE